MTDGSGNAGVRDSGGVPAVVRRRVGEAVTEGDLILAQYRDLPDGARQAAYRREIADGRVTVNDVRRAERASDRPAAYATRNITQPTAEDTAAMRAWLEAIQWATGDTETWTR